MNKHYGVYALDEQEVSDEEAAQAWADLQEVASYVETYMENVPEPVGGAEFIKFKCVCGGCGYVSFDSADDIAWGFEASPLMACGCPWDMLDKAIDKSL